MCREFQETGKRCHMLRFLGLGGAREKVSHVTVSGARGGKGKGVTCYGFWGLGGEGKRCHLLRFLGLGGEKGKGTAPFPPHPPPATR